MEKEVILKDTVQYTNITNDDGRHRVGFLELHNGAVEIIWHEYDQNYEYDGVFMDLTREQAISLAKGILTHFRVPFCNRVSEFSQGASQEDTVDETKENVVEPEPHYHVLLLDKDMNGVVLNFVFFPIEIQDFYTAVGLADSHLRTAYWSAKAVIPEASFDTASTDIYLPLAKEGKVYQVHQHFPIDGGVETYAGVLACDGKKFPEGGVWFGGIELELESDDSWGFSGSELDSLLNNILSS